VTGSIFILLDPTLTLTVIFLMLFLQAWELNSKEEVGFRFFDDGGRNLRKGWRVTMDAQAVIMVQIDGHGWTSSVLHYACSEARQRSARIALVKMIPAQYHNAVLTDLGFLNFSDQDRDELAGYQRTIAEYGVEYSTHCYYYATLRSAIALAAEKVNAQLIFATIPKSRIPFWRRLQLQRLRRYFSRQQRELKEQFV
jgi:hypothetical protein